jgi:hypothetical protein
MGFFSRRPEAPKIYRRTAEFEIVDSKDNVYSRVVSLRERLLWVFDAWNSFHGEEDFEEVIEETFHTLSKGFVDGDKFVFARDIVSIRLVSKSLTEID